MERPRGTIVAKIITEDPSRHVVITQVESERGREGENICVGGITTGQQSVSNLHGVGMYRQG